MKAKRRKSASKKASRGRKMSAGGNLALAREDFLTGSERLFRPIKKPVTLRLDADVLVWFKGRGRGYQTRINQALRGVMIKGRKAGR